MNVEKNRGFSADVVFEAEIDDESRKYLTGMVEDYEELREKESHRLKGMLLEQARIKAQPYISDEMDEGDRNTVVFLIYLGMMEGWNQCYEYHKELIDENSMNA